MLDLAIDLGGVYFIFHPGRPAVYSISKKKLIIMERHLPRRYIGLFSDSIKKILDYAGGRIEVCIEITHAMSTRFLDSISTMTDDNGLGLVWDMGHVELLPPGERERIILFFQDNIKRVKLAHLHDITDQGGHKALGTGRLNIAAYLEIINVVGIDTILEIFPEEELLRSVAYLKNLKAACKSD